MPVKHHIHVEITERPNEIYIQGSCGSSQSFTDTTARQAGITENCLQIVLGESAKRLPFF